MLIFGGDQRELIERRVADAPLVKAGILQAAIGPWVAPIGIGDEYRKRAAANPGVPDKMRTYQLVMLKTVLGARMAAEEQRALLLQIDAMAKGGQLAAAGPVLEGSDLAWIFVFTSNAEETDALTASNPAVKGGKMLGSGIRGWFRRVCCRRASRFPCNNTRYDSFDALSPVATVQIFLSAVTAEFRSYRDALRRDLDRPNVTVKVQEDFIVTGTETLDTLDAYIRQCDATIHLVGDMTGASAQEPSVTLIRQRYPDFGERFPALRTYLAARRTSALLHAVGSVVDSVPPEDADHRRARSRRHARRKLPPR